MLERRIKTRGSGVKGRSMIYLLLLFIIFFFFAQVLWFSGLFPAHHKNRTFPQALSYASQHILLFCIILYRLCIYTIIHSVPTLQHIKGRKKLPVLELGAFGSIVLCLHHCTTTVTMKMLYPVQFFSLFTFV